MTSSRSTTLRTLLSACAGIPIGLLYGLFLRWLFGLDQGSEIFVTLSVGFLFFLPFVIGALTVYVAPPQFRRSTRYVVLMPWLSCLLVVLVIGLLGWEAVICIVMALPIFLPLASWGGYTFRLKTPDAPPSSTTQNVALLLLALAPLLITPFESQRPAADSYRVVENTIVIDAPVERVWEEIASVPMIQPEEQGFSLFHLLGLPKPLEATLSHAGVGGTRNATFEHHLTFVETVTVWEEGEQLSFTIVREPDSRLTDPLTQIGGRYFDVLEGTYRIEPLEDGRVLLRLSSQHRLSTSINFYGGLWTETIMSDLQSYILRIIRVRAEG